MGVDVPNVDLVARIGCLPSLEELVQEFGRDGRQAKGETCCRDKNHFATLPIAF